MSAALAALLALAALAWLLLMARVVLVAARMLQIEEYEAARFVRWGMTREWLGHRSVFAGALVALIALVAALLQLGGAGHAVAVVASGWLAAAAIASVAWRWIPPKKALVVTGRMRRILAAAAVLTAVGAAGIALLVWNAPVSGGVAVLAAAALVTPLAQLVLLVANLVLIPAESSVRRRYLRAAGARMAELHPEVIAVAGSYGKTSTKHILAALLQPCVDTLPTRKSFNTLMGVTRVINEDLEPRHRIFIVEMDAYAAGEIAAMCRLVHPRLAVLTAVGPQHLERFGTVDRIADALYESIASLPTDGVAFVATESPETQRLADRARGEGRSVVTYGVTSDGGPPADVEASGITLSAGGAAFRWTWAARSLAHDVRIPLLGRHQVLNVTAALAVVAQLGQDLDAAVGAAATLPPVEHRLQQIATAPITVIDDSYNANPVGVHAGLDVLALMNGGRKLLVTPGLVELGPLEVEENRRYGEHAAHVCDDVIVMEARPAAALREGLRAGGLAEESIHAARSLDDATALIRRLTRPGDVVLFANDLPDTYLGGR